MLGIFIKMFGIAIGTVLVLFGAANAFRSARRLDRRIAEFKAEQEALQQQGRSIDPYAALAELYAEDRPAPRGPTRSGKDARRARRYADETRQE